jgi:hypothetical protein
MDNCSYCNNERTVDDWREWIKIARAVRWIETSGLTWREALATCRDIKKGWKSYSGYVWHSADCPACEWEK